MAVHEHKNKAHRTVRCAIITLSDTRDETTDKSGQRIKALLAEHEQPVVSYQILKDEPDQITAAVRALLARPDVDVILTNGGTGIAPRDTTFEALQGLLEKEIPGFGEMFRMLSYEDIGSAAMLTRATAGVGPGQSHHFAAGLDRCGRVGNDQAGPARTGPYAVCFTRWTMISSYPEGHHRPPCRGERHAH